MSACIIFPWADTLVSIFECINCWILLYRSMHSGIDTVTEQHWNSKILYRLYVLQLSCKLMKQQQNTSDHMCELRWESIVWMS